MNEKLSPITGQPRLPGIPSIAFGEAHAFSKNATKSTNMSAISMLNISIAPFSNQQKIQDVKVLRAIANYCIYMLND